MRWTLFLLFVLTCAVAFSQSPYLSVRATISQKSSYNYKIEMKLCKLKNPSEFKNVYGSDTSVMEFKSLGNDDIICGSYWGTQHTIDTLHYNSFDWADQEFGFEKIIVFKITNVSKTDRGSMYVIVPVKYQSFVTYVELMNISVQEGKVLYINDFPDSRTKSGRLHIKPEMSLYIPVSKEKFSLKLELD